MNLERAIRIIESMQDEIEHRIESLPPPLRDHTGLWSDLEALSIAKSAIYKEMERKREAGKQKSAIVFPKLG